MSGLTLHRFASALRAATCLSPEPCPQPALDALLSQQPIGGTYGPGDLRAGVELLIDLGLAKSMPHGVAQTGTVTPASVLRRSWVRSAPPWLADAIVEGTVDWSAIPVAAERMLAFVADPTDRDALLVSLDVHVDIERRAALGEQGEIAVLSALQGAWAAADPAMVDRVRRVSLDSDAYGFDLVAPSWKSQGVVSRHLEVKTCSWRSSAPWRIYLSRHEAAVAASDPEWRLVVCTARLGGQTRIVGWVGPDVLAQLLPVDQTKGCRWESARLDLAGHCVTPGLPVDIPDELAHAGVRFVDGSIASPTPTTTAAPSSNGAV